MDALLKEIGLSVNRYRKAQGLTQTALAKKAGLDYRYIGFVEQGRVNATVKTLEKITNALGICLCDLCPPKNQRPEPKATKQNNEKEQIKNRILRNLNKCDIHALKLTDNFMKIIKK